MSLNPTPHLCRSKVKQTALEMAKQLRPFWKVERVGMSFLEKVEAAVRAKIAEIVKQHPTRGKTLL
jgi:2-oxo-4-hydroxy-4-carboxy--5-ureidoimidazoline (OHCU) decarboxylase